MSHMSEEGERAELELRARSVPQGLAVGPDGALWVALESGLLARITVTADAAKVLGFHNVGTIPGAGIAAPFTRKRK